MGPAALKMITRSNCDDHHFTLENREQPNIWKYLKIAEPKPVKRRAVKRAPVRKMVSVDLLSLEDENVKVMDVDEVRDELLEKVLTKAQMEAEAVKIETRTESVTDNAKLQPKRAAAKVKTRAGAKSSKKV